MILTTSTYSSHLFKSLNKASEVWIAVGLINKKGFELIRNNLPKGVTQNYLIGINLPSDINVLRELKKLSDTPYVNAKIYNTQPYFHPKVYIVKKHNGYSDAFIGSSNATNPGFNFNVELNIKITDQEQVDDLLSWFEDHFQKGEEITAAFLKKYQIIQKRMLRRETQNEKESLRLPKKKTEQVITPKLSRKKWNEQFFKKEHYDAFAIDMQYNHSLSANAKRKKVKDKLKELHERIYPQFKEFKLLNLKKHYHAQNIISHYDYREGFTKEQRSAIWLHYGKDVSELEKYSSGGNNSFVNHIRIQIIFRCDEVGVWLVLGKDFGGVQDRRYFKTQMTNSLLYRSEIFKLIHHLPDDYWIEVAGREKDIRAFGSANQFYDFVSKDLLDNYFIIGKTFSPDNKLLSENNIAGTMLAEIKRLYPLYEKMKDKNPN